MMQHTQTHEKSKKIAPCPDAKMNASTTVPVNPVPRPSMTPIKTEPNCWNGQQGNMSDLIMATSFVPPPGQSSMVNSRTLPLPTRRASFSSYNNAPYPTSNYRLSHPQAVPAPFYGSDVSMQAHNIPRNRSSWPSRQETYPNTNYHKPPLPVQYQNIEDYDNDMCRRSSTSTLSSDSTLISPAPHQYPQDEHIARRRISIDDLRLPIEHLKNIQLDEKSRYKHYDNDTVDITCDEFEALEGFSKFHSGSVVAEESPSPVAGNVSNIVQKLHKMSNDKNRTDSFPCIT